MLYCLGVTVLWFRECLHVLTTFFMLQLPAWWNHLLQSVHYAHQTFADGWSWPLISCFVNPTANTQNGTGGRDSTTPTTQTVPKAALCFIVSYEHRLHHEALWREWIEPNRDIINVYVHYKRIENIASPWLRAFAIPPKYVNKTSYYNVVPAYMSVLSFAFNHDTQNQWFCMLTDTCVPVITPAQFRRRLKELHGMTIMRSFPAHWNLTLHQRANLRLLKPEYWLANDPWFTLCRKHVHQCMIFMAMKNSIYNIVNAGGLANESLFAIVLQTFRERDHPQRHVNLSSTLCDWERKSSPTSPYYFCFPPKDTIMNDLPNLLWRANENCTDAQKLERDVQQIKTLLANPDNRLCMFMRKVHVSFPDEKIKECMQYAEQLEQASRTHAPLLPSKPKQD